MSGERVAPSAVAEMRARAEYVLKPYDSMSDVPPAVLARDVLALTDALAAVTAERDEARESLDVSKYAYKRLEETLAAMVERHRDVILEAESRLLDVRRAAEADRDRLAGQVAALRDAAKEAQPYVEWCYRQFNETHPDAVRAAEVLVQLDRALSVLGETPQEETPEEARSAETAETRERRPRTFTMYRRGDLSATHDSNQANSADDPQFEGVVFSDGRCALRWLTPKGSVSVWDSFDDAMAIHGHPEYDSEIAWHCASRSGAEGALSPGVSGEGEERR